MSGTGQRFRGWQRRAPDFEFRKARAAVLVKYARLTASGKPIVCIASQADKVRDEIMHYRTPVEGKVIFDTKEAADRAANELYQLGCGRQQSYQCRRSRHGHQHLRTVNR